MKIDPFVEHLARKHKNPAFIDECGTGAIFGPVTACAVMMPKPFWDDRVNDSKKLKHETIYKLAPVLKKNVIYSIGTASSHEIRTLRSTFAAGRKAMLRAIKGLPELPDALFIDGKYPLNTGLPEYTIVRGDSKVFGIAAASIICKDHRDHHVMRVYGDWFARYRIRSNKGYRSPDHLLAIRKWGCTCHHREYMPQIQRVLTGDYDKVIFSKYKDRWKKLLKEKET
jgi:ribonuclease HII